ncbi:alpha/beta hydrolase [Geomonas sp. RF6]|uniref:alpha/beta fold hydrolase n=1 Tax=Geomonas sp. RF6 TaxID=2897342 RepID=UPI001E60F424|nr:alpha/beta hydrolase [Geomonas sp. RF6]UFS69399.1 alpha/beta hydrolase [Geomonas sp. RF6]
MKAPLRECTLSPREILRYRVYGSGEKRVLLLHGLAARSECWIDIVPLFPSEEYTVYLVDLLGSGESSKPRGADYSIQAHANRLLDFIEREGVAGIVPVGHSLGGAVVLVAAIEAMRQGRERLFPAMVVMAGPGFIQRLPLMAEVFQLPLAGPLFVALYAPDIWVKVGLRAAYHDSRLVDREHVRRYAPCYRDRDSKRALVATCRQLVPPDCEELTRCYGDLRLPVLLLWGRHDHIVPLSQGQRLVQAIPGSRLEVLEDCGHNPQEEKPAETFRVIDSFVRTLHA